MPDQVARLQSALADRYVFERELGRGGMASVYLTSDLRHQRKVAVKVLRPELVAAVSRERFQREISIVAHLTHPHILPLYDSGVVGDTCFFVMPYVKGETLRSRLDREGQLPIEEALRLACEVADALAYAHSQNVVHRDIKPQNIMLESGHAVVADFGIAVVTDDLPGTRLTQTGFSLGSPHYMSPEQATATRRLDGRTDIYSLGCVLYEMLAGTPPFTGANVYAILARHAAEPPPSIRVVRQTVTEFLEQVTFQAMAKSPADRYRSAADLVEALTAVTHERVRQTGPGRTTIPPRERAAGNGSPSTEVHSGHHSSRSDTSAKHRVLGSRSLLAAVTVVLLVPTVAGVLTTAAFDTKLQIPTRFTPSTLNFPFVGLRTLVPSLLYALGFCLFFLVSRFFLRVGITMLFGDRLNDWFGRRKEALKTRCERGLDVLGPVGVCDVLLASVLLASTVVLYVFWPIFVPLIVSNNESLACEYRSLHLWFQPTMTALILAVGIGWFVIDRWLMSKHGWFSGLPLRRVGIVSILAVLTAIMVIPWRIMWAGGNERVRIGGDQGYIVIETPTELVIYNASKQMTSVYRKTDTDALERLGLKGNIFEEPDVFNSGLPLCEATYNART